VVAAKWLRTVVRVTGIGLMVLVAGCSGAGSSTGSEPVRSGTSDAETPSDAESSPGLRGTPIDALKCDFSHQVVWGRPISGTPQTFIVCDFAGSQGLIPVAAVTSEDGELFTGLSAALSLPDVARTQGTACPDLAVLTPPILLRTTSGLWSVHIPTRVCGTPRPEVAQALRAIRAS
jgi:hypothetical protein